MRLSRAFRLYIPNAECSRVSTSNYSTEYNTLLSTSYKVRDGFVIPYTIPLPRRRRLRCFHVVSISLRACDCKAALSPVALRRVLFSIGAFALPRTCVSPEYGGELPEVSPIKYSLHRTAQLFNKCQRGHICTTMAAAISSSNIDVFLSSVVFPEYITSISIPQMPSRAPRGVTAEGRSKSTTNVHASIPPGHRVTTGIVNHSLDRTRSEHSKHSLAGSPTRRGCGTLSREKKSRAALSSCDTVYIPASFAREYYSRDKEPLLGILEACEEKVAVLVA